jgi:hypothetical protein
MRFLLGIIVGILIGEVGLVRIAEALQSVVDTLKTLV